MRRRERFDEKMTFKYFIHFNKSISDRNGMGCLGREYIKCLSAIADFHS